MKDNNKVFFRLTCLALLVFVAIIFFRTQQAEKKEKCEQAALSAHSEAALSVIHNRKSVRNFVPDKPVSEEDILTIVKAGMAAPSARDIRPWEILIIDDREALDSLSAGLPYAKMLETAPLAIVVCGDNNLSPLWMYDCSAVTQNILLAVEALGLGAVWTAVYPYEDRIEAVMKNTGLPHHILPLAVIPVGYPNGNFEPKDKFDETKIHRNKWKKEE